jgi:predicted esterase
MIPHAGQPVMSRGRTPAPGGAAMIMIHGRNAGPRNILELADLLPHAGFTYLAPSADGGTWYPYSFLAETERNEPGLSSGLWVIEDLIRGLEMKGIPPAQVILLGFSQGACLSAEYAVRHATHYGGLAVLSGGLIGPPGTTWHYPGSFSGTPILLGCSDVDPHIPSHRVEESARIFTGMGAAVSKRIYPGLGHQVNDDELAWVREVMAAVAGPG